MYLSSLYGPVYLVSHIVTMYMMPELGLIIALEPSRKSGFQTVMHPEDSSTAVHVTMWSLPIKMTFNELSSIKTGDGCISNVQLEDYDLNPSLPLNYLKKEKKRKSILSQLCIIFF